MIENEMREAEVKILVLSDSHSALSFMRVCIERVKPDAVVHLGDYVSDGEAMEEEYPSIRFYQVAGNCDRYRVAPDFPEVLNEKIGGVRIYMTHGHLQKVKLYLGELVRCAAQCRAQVALYGHTHEPDCQQLEDGMWIMNPGSCGYYGGSAGLIEIASDEVISCRIIRHEDLEALS